MIGVFVVIGFSLLCILIYFLIKAIFKLSTSKEISIYVDEKKEQKSEIHNTPFVVGRDGKERLSTDIIDDTVIKKIRKVRE